MELVSRLAQLIPSIGHSISLPPLVNGIGDDAAVLRPSPGSEWVASTDFSLEGTHFRPEYPPESIGYKALARATSDLVAMGAQPRYFLLALALPAERTGKWLRRFASGMSRAARELNMRLIGGDTSQSKNITICITVLGKAHTGLSVLRSGAKPGDHIYVSGTLGAAQLGLALIRRRLAAQPPPKKCLRAHLYPQIPAALGHALARHRIPSAMMDVSDGLSTDLARLCAASHVGAQIRADQLPMIQVPPALLSRGIDPLALALHGGEDYGLLFTVPPHAVPRLSRIARHIKITRIGEMTRHRDITLIHPDGRSSPLPAKGWNPFR
jgi:thiamine-monophosphate kinase